ncbi:MAG TPA: hypothetical protein VFH15_03030 [Pyrinomonadaceae bacterium]|nr:hypothetical protein [Pyrinomonadaceae bacterium]
MKLKEMKINKQVVIGVLFFAFITVLPAQAADEAEVRGTVQRVFQQLKSRDYSALYDSLPSSSRARMTRDRFATALKRAQDMYVLDRMDVGQVRLAKDIAVVDTVLYGRVVAPLAAEGKIVVQQYLVREDGKWRVATGDSGTIKRFLANNPAFRAKFPIRQPRVFVKQGNNWVEFSPGQKRA